MASSFYYEAEGGSRTARTGVYPLPSNYDVTTNTDNVNNDTKTYTMDDYYVDTSIMPLCFLEGCIPLNNGQLKEMGLDLDKIIRPRKRQRMDLESYKQKIWDFLTKVNKCSPEVASSLMKEYENDFQDFLEEGWSPEAAGTGMMTHLA